MVKDQPDLKGLRILVVEDAFLIADLLCDALESHGCEVVGPASNIDKGLQMARDKPLDGAFLDINLAGDLCFPIAAALHERGVPFLFLTGYDDPTVIPPDFRGVRRLRKPFDPEEVTVIAADTFRSIAA